MADAASAAASVTDKAATEDLTPSTTILDGMRVYFVIGAIGWMAFEVGRVKLQRAFYCREDKAETTNATVTRCHNAKVFAWLKLLFFTSDDEILEQCGMDTLFFLRFLRLCEKVTLVGILCSAANFPIYYYAKRDTLDPLYRMTLSHLDTDEMWRFWLTVVTMYLVSLTTCFLLWKEYEEYIRRRHEFMSRKHTQQYTVVLNGLPPNLCTQQTLRNYLELLFPKSVLHVYVALECRDLEKLVAERVKVRNKLEHVLAQSAKTGDRVLTRDKLLGGEQVDAVELYQEQLKELNTAVEKEVRGILRNQAGVARQLVESSGDDESLSRGFNQNFDSARSVNFAYKEEELDGDALESRYIKSLKRQDKNAIGIMRPAGFVTFRSLKAAQSCTQILQSADPTQMHVEAAAHADDVVWENIGLSKNVKDTWFLISMCLSTAIILLWTVPTGIVVSFAKVSTLEKQWAWLATVIENNPWVKSLLEQLSPLMLSVMTALAPIIFGILSKREGHAFASQVDASLLNKLVIYQIYVTFLLPIIGGTVIDAVIGSSSTDLTDVSAVLKLISDSVAVQSSFFITYLLVKTGLNLTLILLRVTPIVKAAIYQVFAPKLTPRERSSPWFGLTSLAHPGDFGASDQVSEYYLVLMLVLVFCAIAPILNYFAMLYLVLSDFVYRWAVMCVHDPSTQTLGTFFPSLYRFIVGALMFAQIIMASVLATKQVALPATFSIFLPFITLAFHLFVNSRYPHVALNLPLDQAVIIDSRRSRQMQDLERVLEDMYMQPAMLERGPLEPDYQGLSSDPNPENQLASPPPVEKDSFRSQDKQLFSPNNVQGIHPAAYELSQISLSQSNSSSSGYASRSQASRSNGSRMFDVESPSAASAAKDFLYQRQLAPNAVPLLVRLQRHRILWTAVLGVSVVVVALTFLQRGIVLKSYAVSSNGSVDSGDIDTYNFYVGLCTSVLVKPLLGLVGAVVPAVLLCFLTEMTMQETTSRRTRLILALLGNAVLWFLLNGFMAVYVSEQAAQVDAAIGDSDLADYENSSSLSDSNRTSNMDTILRSAMQMPDATAENAVGQCSRPSPRRLPAQLNYGFPSRIDTVEMPTMPMELTAARNLVSYALRATDDFYREQDVPANASAFELLDLPVGFESASTDDMSITQALVQAMNDTLNRAVETRTHLQNFSVAESSVEFVQFPWSTDSGELVFEGVTLEIPMDVDFLLRDLTLLNDTTQAVVYGAQVLNGLFEINAKEECGRYGCVVSPVGATLTTAPVDEGSQVRALPVCLDADGNEDYKATMDVDGIDCAYRSNNSVLVLSFAKRIVGDAISSSLVNNSNGEALVVMLTNARKIYQVTAGRLSWKTTDLAAKYEASCEASDCNGLAFPLSNDDRQVIVGAEHLPVNNLTTYSPSLLLWTPLVTSNVQEVDKSDILKSDFVFPNNFDDTSGWTPVNGSRCERERGAFMDRVQSSHLYSERSLHPAYQSALFWLFQHGVVKQKLSETTLAFDASVKYVDVTISVPQLSATLTFVGCAMLVLMSVLVFFGGKSREAEVERHFKPHHLARVLLDDQAFSHRLLKCDLLNVGNKYLNSSELLDQFEISGLALRHRKRPSDVLIVPKGQQSTTASAASSQAVHIV
ncbi:hypothetical protein PF005_g7444 [Phytophthora fragariae]|uniref:CSC1/OSCA1-like 7TM region domain-containing protein n=1 Tax=Phytophthora fragariae TaxID=53985 RepID=A0A6A3FS16_9STRA|nr:hypothetical protein PF009_g1478 [Phytophthora fragariae]KAE9018228.1 hypothetical protein PF011_g6359 [Phytophthora fragariae]KAE9121900.1 hypothetical protein PF007_g7646 [Phytophthora fragariae]KAE9220519.1 hypothetical protein PF005_g7444 [Phytophthora fragariae]KAE9254060.1 hypothetical protein PF004_g1204 [Phytophthora fragariae]